MTDCLRELRRFFLLILVVFFTLAIIKVALNFDDFYKHDINYASQADIRACTDIGDKLSYDIYQYIQCNEIDRVRDLEGRIKGVGDKRLQELEEVFK